MAHHPESDTIKIIAHIQTEFNTKFGVPRQSGLIDSLRGRIVFEPEYRIADALRGIEGFSHLWLIWQFSEARRDSAATHAWECLTHGRRSVLTPSGCRR